MKTILLAAKALNDIKHGAISFADFSNQLRGKEYIDLDYQAKRQVRTFVSCALHKNEVTRFTLVQHGLDELQPLNQSIVTVFLCNLYFLKILQVEKEDLLTLIENEVDKEKISSSELIEGTVKSLFPEQLDFRTSFALSLRYNFPLDFVERLIEDLGFNKAQRFLDKFSNVYQIHGRINLNKITDEKFFLENKDFKQIALMNAFVYEGKQSIKTLQTYKDCVFYTMPITDLVISEQLLGFNPTKVLIKEEEKTSMVIDLAKLNPELKIEVEVNDKHRYHVVNSVIKMFALTNVTAATSDRAEQPSDFDLVYVTPSSSNLEQIKARPDFFINFDMTIDHQQKILSLLDEYQKRVTNNGLLVIKVGSLLRNETVDVTQTFIANHPDFVLEYERQYMPYHKEQTIAYYAIFRKKTNE